VGFVVDKVALGQVFSPEYFDFPLSSSITREKNEKKLTIFLIILITGLLRGVCSICCGAIHHKKTTI
jgi:hypothetical protein